MVDPGGARERVTGVSLVFARRQSSEGSRWTQDRHESWIAMKGGSP